jgi:putative Mn2+ efflux pump MntP
MKIFMKILKIAWLGGSVITCFIMFIINYFDGDILNMSASGVFGIAFVILIGVEMVKDYINTKFKDIRMYDKTAELQYKYYEEKIKILEKELGKCEVEEG